MLENDSSDQFTELTSYLEAESAGRPLTVRENRRIKVNFNPSRAIDGEFETGDTDIIGRVSRDGERLPERHELSSIRRTDRNLGRSHIRTHWRSDRGGPWSRSGRGARIGEADLGLLARSSQGRRLHIQLIALPRLRTGRLEISANRAAQLRCLRCIVVLDHSAKTPRQQRALKVRGQGWVCHQSLG